MTTNSFTLKVAGKSGQGINSIGEILANALKDLGYYTFGYREYPSLIKGGNASYQIEISDTITDSVHKQTDVLLAISKESVFEYMTSIKQGGVLIHAIKGLEFSPIQQANIDEAKIKVYFLDANELGQELGGSSVLANVIMLSLLWKSLGLKSKNLEGEFNKRFKSKQELLKLDIKALNHVYEKELLSIDLTHLFESLDKSSIKINKSEHITISGNHALALGSLSAGLRAVYAYPMTPATSIFSYLANTAYKTGVLVKQAEDEITAVQMTIGSSFAGTRAMTVTSGGGFDLMAESISMSGITETPLVIVLAQRPGPSTGLPTWTSAADLEAALYSGHGEFPRCVIAASDAKSAYSVIQKAFNISEVYQLPVIVLTDKYIAESLYHVDDLELIEKIERGLTKKIAISKQRYMPTPSGISNRWIPGSQKITYKANSDEHTGDGSSTEDPITAKKMYDKRMRKLDTLATSLEEPLYTGPKTPDYCLISWGSNKGVIQDSIKKSGLEDKIGYLHYEYIWPLKTETIKKLVSDNTKLIVVELNATAQLGKLLSQNIDNLAWYDKYLKYDGRPFYIEDLTNFILELK